MMIIMSLKVSLIVIIDEFNEKSLKECLYSLINQSLKEIEIICISTYYEKTIEEFSKIDDRIKHIVANKNNLKFEGLKQATSEYIAFINSNDWIDFDFCEILYTQAKKTDSDIVIYKPLKYYNGNWFEDYFYHFFNFQEKFLKDTFTHQDIGDILFSIPKEVYNKFFKNNFSKEKNPFFENNPIFEDIPFFFRALLESKQITLCDEFIYFKRSTINSNSITENILIDVTDCTNDLISIFKNSEYYKLYEKKLWNYKFDLIRFWYFSIEENIKENSIEYLRDDFKFMVDNFLPNFEKILTKQNLFFYENIHEYNNSEVINKIYENNNLKNYNTLLLKEKEDLAKTNTQIQKEKEDHKKVLQNENNTLKRNINDLLNKNNMLIELSKKQNILINKQNEKLFYLKQNTIFLKSNINKSKKSDLNLFNKLKKNLKK